MRLPFTTNVTAVKDSTQVMHAEVENLLLQKLQALHTINDYAAILQLFYGFYSPLEGAIGLVLTTDELSDLPLRMKAELLLQDLQMLHRSVRGLPVCTTLPPIQNKASAFGALYVMESLTLGGKMISRMLLRNSVLSLPQNAVRFFTGYGSQTGTRWKSFLTAFNKIEDTDLLVKTATATFFALKCWMQQTLYHD